MTTLKITALIAALALAAPSSYSLARDADKGGGPPGKGQSQNKEHGKGHMHHQASGRNLLGAKIKENGKHAVGKLKDRTVNADVKNGKVTNMEAGDLPVKRVKTKMKMADAGGAIRLAAWSGFQSVQYYDDWYYGYCFDDGYDFYCYWYPAEEVDYIDYYWEDYDPYY